MRPNDLSNRIFGRLTVLNRAKNPGTRKNDTAAYWNCICECGNEIVIRGYSLTSGKTRSCGCLKKESPHLKAFCEPKYSSDISTARILWSLQYKELSFNDYYRLSQLPCYYCGIEPKLIKRAYHLKYKNAEPFIYNTLDRVNSNKGHTIDNVIPCCKMCNCSKMTKSIEEFYTYIDDLITNLDRISPEEYRSGCNTPYTENVIFNEIHHKYIDGGISKPQLYSLIKSNCYYCGAKPSNNKRGFIYNGIDRIDNTLDHRYDNVVPCCKYCNLGKNASSLEKFNNWIRQLAIHRPIREKSPLILPYAFRSVLPLVLF